MPGKRAEIEVFAGNKRGGECHRVGFAGTEQFRVREHFLGARRNVIVRRLRRRLIQENLDISDLPRDQQDEIVPHRKLGRSAERS